MYCCREYNLEINDRAFLAIKELRKKVEIRANNDSEVFDYGKIHETDIINFINSRGEKMECRVTKISWYKSIENLLNYEGTEYTLSSTNDFDEGVKSINSITGYKEGIAKNGVYAIHIEPIKH